MLTNMTFHSLITEPSSLGNWAAGSRLGDIAVVAEA